jgi:hypothetical protein
VNQVLSDVRPTGDQALSKADSSDGSKPVKK